MTRPIAVSLVLHAVLLAILATVRIGGPTPQRVLRAIRLSAPVRAPRIADREPDPDAQPQVRRTEAPPTRVEKTFQPPAAAPPRPKAPAVRIQAVKPPQLELAVAPPPEAPQVPVWIENLAPPPPAIRTGNLAAPRVETGRPRPRAEVKTAGFAAPVASLAQAPRIRLSADAGFGAATAAASAAATGRTTANAGFGAAETGPATGASPGANPALAPTGAFNTEAAPAPVDDAHIRAPVSEGGFSRVELAVPAARGTPQPSAPQATTPVEVVSKPRPVYTEEARRLGIEGEVLLEVIFGAGGELRVLRVAQGLGHGLDEAARRAALQIRYRPARRNGKPVDAPATVHIIFQLAY